MATYQINQLYQGTSLPVTVTIDGDEHVSDDQGQIVDPPTKVAYLLEGMPEWSRIEGGSPFGPKDVVAHV